MEIKCLGSGSTGNCYIVHQEGITYLLDAGVDIRKITAYTNLNEVEFAFISHEHKDHSLNLEKLDLKGVKTIYGKYVEKFTKTSITSQNNINIEIFTFPIEHDDCKNAGIIVRTPNECLLYVTDFTLCKYDLTDFKFNKILVECNYDDAKHNIPRKNWKRHLGYSGLVKFIDKAINLTPVEEIILIHLSTEAELIDKSIIRFKARLDFQKRIGICRQHGGIDWYGG